MKKNLWILTEERPKKEVLSRIIKLFCDDRNAELKLGEIAILPMFDSKHNFTFTYEVKGVRSDIISGIYIKTVSGNSSFCDFLIFHQDDEPAEGTEPLYLIEETKTDDGESRNTGVYQRSSKFVYAEKYFRNAKKIMLYNLQVQQKETPTETNIFGTRLLLTLGVGIVGKDLDSTIFKPFTSLDELIESKKFKKKAPKGNVPIEITKVSETKLTISGRLFKSGSLAHDPNIGALSIISAAIRKLGWTGEIEITKHGLSQSHIKAGNKFIKIADELSITLESLTMPKNVVFDKLYWKYERKGEKLGTIFVHLAVEGFTNAKAIFENHAGSEKGYFITKDGQHLALPKYTDKDSYKAGDKTKIYYIPDLIIWDKDRNEIINIEGKTYANKKNGIEELKNYGPIENDIIKPKYKDCKIIRTVVLYGSNETSISEKEVGFLLTEAGKIVLGPNAPAIFSEAKCTLYGGNPY